MAPSKSEMWKYFSPIDSKNVQCNLCGKDIRSSGNTTNMKSHLIARHNENGRFNNFKKKEQKSSARSQANIIINTSGQIQVAQYVDDKPMIVYDKLVVPNNMRSVFWKYYGFPANEAGEIVTKSRIVCILCKCFLKYSNNTNKLRKHLQKKHHQASYFESFFTD